MRKKTRVLLADDHAILRHGMRQLVNAQSDMTVVAEATDGAEAVALAAKLRPDVVIMDLSMPGMGGIDATREVRAASAESKVLVLTVHEDRGYLREVFEAGAIGYILKRAAMDELVDAIRAVAAGRAFVDQRIASELGNLFTASSRRRATDVPDLTVRELDTLRYLAEGFANKEIAARLDLSVKSVETYKARAMRKLGLRSRVDIVRLARERRWPPIR